MSSNMIRNACMAVCAVTLSFALAFAQPTTTKSTTPTGAATTTQEVTGTVLAVDGNNLVLRMSTGEIRNVVAPESARALIDGKEVAAKDLKVGTKLKATITTTTTSVVDRTVTVGSGKVFFVNGPYVILTLPNNENRQYKVADSYKFMVDGKPASVYQLKKGMKVSAEKIVEEPRVVVTANRVITGEAPPPVKTETAAVSAPAPAPTPKPAAPARAEAPAPAPTPQPAAPAELPKTGSPLPLIGLAGALLTGCSLGARALRRGR
jgi:hypothetical protein